MTKFESKTWFELFSIGYFNHEKYNTDIRSKFQAQTLDRITASRDDSSNSIIFYNPITSSYYRPPAFRLDESRLPITNFPNSLQFDGGLDCDLIWDKTGTIHEPLLPVTHVSIKHDDALDRGTTKNITIPVSPIPKCAVSPPPEQTDNGYISTGIPESTPYVIILEFVTTFEKSYEDLIQAVWDDVLPSNLKNAAALDGIPHFLCHYFKVTMDHKGESHKGYINYSPEFGLQFIVRQNARSRKIDFTVPLPDFKQHWTTIIGGDIFFQVITQLDHY